MKIKVLQSNQSTKCVLQIEGINGLTFIDIFKSDAEKLLKQQIIDSKEENEKLTIYKLI